MPLVITWVQSDFKCQPNEFVAMKSSNPASLQNLNDIVLPATVDWWPLASGWYVLLGLILIVLSWLAFRAVQHRIANRYRREAMRELQRLSEGVQNKASRDASLRQLPVLLKRTALSAYPRSQVAALSGDNWLVFLNSRLKKPVFTNSASISLEKISYSTGELSAIDSQAATELIAASLQWVKLHQPAARLKDRSVI
jgi:hypothetical protein